MVHNYLNLRKMRARQPRAFWNNEPKLLKIIFILPCEGGVVNLIKWKVQSEKWPGVMGQGLRLKGGKAQRFPALGILGGLEAAVQSQGLAFGLHVFDE